MIQGLGTDIIEVKRIEASIARFGKRFLDRLFSPEEQAYCLSHRDAARHFAGRFAAKEAIAKALGSGFGGALSWSDVKIINDGHGKPEVILSPQLKRSLGNLEVLVSISHSRDYATAFAICQDSPQT